MTHHLRILADLPNMVDLIREKRLAYTLIEAREKSGGFRTSIHPGVAE